MNTFSISDFLVSYPEISDKSFYQDIYTKKEFNELKLKSQEEAPSIGELTNSQQILTRLLSSYTPYQNMLLFHTMGTGKTCVAVSIAETLKEQQPQFYKRAVIFAPNEQLIENFKRQIVYKCNTFDKYAIEYDTSKEQTIRINKVLSKFYEFNTFQTFAKKIKDHPNISSIYDNCILIVDEVHNIRYQDTGKSIDTYDYFFKFLHAVKNCKILLLSGTPMPDSPGEFAETMNLILPNSPEFQFPKANEFVSKYYTKNKLNSGLIPEIKEKIKGYVSFLKETRNDNVKIEYQGYRDSKDDIGFYPLQKIPMEDFQFQVYNKTMQADEKKSGSEMFYSNVRQVLLSVFPDGSYGDPGFKKYIVKKGNMYKFTREFQDELKGSTDSETLDNIRKYSCKYAFIIEKILNSPGICFVYSEFVYGSGIILFSCFLRLFSFAQARGKIDQKQPRFALFTMDSNIQGLIDVANNIANKNGEYIKVLIGSRRISEGYTFRNVRDIFIVNPFFNYTRIEQAIYRGIRLGSHDITCSKELCDPVKIKIYLCEAEIPAGIVGDDKVENVDAYLYNLMKTKDYQIKQLTRVIMESAVDCYLNYSRNKSPNELAGTRECEYQSCDYTCDGINETHREIDYSTYDLLYFNKIPEVVSYIGTVLKNSSMTKEGLVNNVISVFPNIPLLRIKTLVEKLANANSDEISYLDYLNYFSSHRTQYGISIIKKIEKIFLENFYLTYSEIKKEIDSGITDFELVSILNYFIQGNIEILNKYGFISYLREQNNMYFLVDNIKSESKFELNYYSQFVDIDASISSEYTNLIPYKSIIKNILKGSGDMIVNIEFLPAEHRQALIEALYLNEKTVSSSVRKNILDYFKSHVIESDKLVMSNIVKPPKIFVKSEGTWKNMSAQMIKVLEARKKEKLERFVKDNEYGVYGTYNNEKFCLTVQSESEEKDLRKVKTGRVCETMPISTLEDTLFVLNVPREPSLEGNPETKIDLGKLPDRFKNELDQEKKLNYVFWRSKYSTTKLLCKFIRKILDERGLLFQDDNCGTALKTKKLVEKQPDFYIIVYNKKSLNDVRVYEKIIEKYKLDDDPQGKILVVYKNKNLKHSYGFIMFNESKILNVQIKNETIRNQVLKYFEEKYPNIKN